MVELKTHGQISTIAISVVVGILVWIQTNPAAFSQGLIPYVPVEYQGLIGAIIVFVSILYNAVTPGLAEM